MVSEAPACPYHVRGLQEKRRRQAEIENRRRQLEDDRRQLQHLKVGAEPRMGVGGLGVGGRKWGSIQGPLPRPDPGLRGRDQEG